MSEDFRTVQRRFAAWIRDPESNPPPENIESRRMEIYRRLFYNNLEGFLRNGFPVLYSLLSAERWQRLVRAFMAGHAAQSPYFVEIPGEFVQWLATDHEPEPEDPPFMAELAHYEYMEVVLTTSTDEIPATGYNPEGDLLAAAPMVSPLICVLAYAWPVHRISAEFQPSEPLEQPVWLLIYRNRADRVRFMEINAPTARLLELLEQSPLLPGRLHLEQLARELGYSDPAEVVRFGADMLEQLRQRDIIPGTRLEDVEKL